MNFLNPHHDGSSLYVSDSAPAIGDEKSGKVLHIKSTSATSGIWILK